jgi:AraC family transcriptional regulator of adaptative response/methylated-DNA-[protein]-cysteine methyltransferase
MNIIDIASPLGPMKAAGTSQGICLLAFQDQQKLPRQLQKLSTILNSPIIQTSNAHLDLLTQELKAYFSGLKQHFSVPLHIVGTAFQQSVWRSLQKIPYGKTWSYKNQAEILQHPLAVRAVAAANANNPIAIIIPCHRVIGSNGKLTGYAGGLHKKAWLLKHEHAIE